MSDNPVSLLSRDLASQAKQLQSMLPHGMDVNKFMRTTINGITSHAQADKLMSADRRTLFLACQKAAADGLLLDGREATLVTYHSKKKGVDEVQYIPMVQGLVKLARNSGDITSIVAEMVFSEDGFKYRPGIDPQPIHEPDWFGNRGNPMGCYAVVTTQQGEKITTVMSQQQILNIASGGHNGDKYSPVKGKDFQEWWKKTAIKNVLKYVPRSSELDHVVQQDHKQERPELDTAPESLPTPPHAEPPHAQEVKQIFSDLANATCREHLTAIKQDIEALPLAVQQQAQLMEAFSVRWSQLPEAS